MKLYVINWDGHRSSIEEAVDDIGVPREDAERLLLDNLRRTRDAYAVAVERLEAQMTERAVEALPMVTIAYVYADGYRGAARSVRCSLASIDGFFRHETELNGWHWIIDPLTAAQAKALGAWLTESGEWAIQLPTRGPMFVKIAGDK